MRIILIFSVLFSLSGFVVAQADSDKPFEIPSSYTNVLLVNNPTCPIHLDGPTRVIGWQHGGMGLIYNIQNVSKANVESYVIQEWDWFGAHGYELELNLREDIFFVPWMTISSSNIDDELDTLAKFDEKKIAKTIPPLMNKLWVAMVVKVKLSDGTIYDATENYNKLSKFQDDFLPSAAVATPDGLEIHEKNLRELLSTFTVKK